MSPPPDSVISILGRSDGTGHLYRVHRKKGHVFALVPSEPRLQAQLAPLLPAQSPVARLYRAAVRLSGSFGFSFPRETMRVALSPSNATVALCTRISLSTSAPLLLPGNPRGAAPRLILICLDSSGQPAGVIKAGHAPAARELVHREASILAKIPQGQGHQIAPCSLGVVDTDDTSAFAMEFVAGRSPAWPPKATRLQAFLSGCIDTSRTIPIAESPLWNQLRRQEPAPLQPSSNFSFPAFQPFSVSAFQRLSSTPIHPCLFHGDFAPWNIRESSEGSWTAIDWERGERDGIPGWDWFHFLVQPAILVKKWPAERVLAFVRDAIQSREFQCYLAQAIPAFRPEIAEDLLRAYLLYNWHVLKPTERSEVHQALTKWAMVEK